MEDEKLLLFSTKDELLNAFDEFKKDTCSGWRCVGRDKNFGK
jgi:hypothetical protein